VNFSERVSLLAQVLVEYNHIDHISAGLFAGFLGAEKLLILVEFFYLRKIAIPQTYQHDRKGEGGGLDYFLFSVVEVVNSAVCKHDKHVVVGRLSFSRLCELDGHIDDLAQFTRPMWSNFLQIFAILFDDLLHPTNYQRLEIVPIQGKTLPN
jgi:hypothetical protein